MLAGLPARSAVCDPAAADAVPLAAGERFRRPERLQLLRQSLAGTSCCSRPRRHCRRNKWYGYTDTVPVPAGTQKNDGRTRRATRTQIIQMERPRKQRRQKLMYTARKPWLQLVHAGRALPNATALHSTHRRITGHASNRHTHNRGNHSNSRDRQWPPDNPPLPHHARCWQLQLAVAAAQIAPVPSTAAAGANCCWHIRRRYCPTSPPPLDAVLSRGPSCGPGGGPQAATRGAAAWCW